MSLRDFGSADLAEHRNAAKIQSTSMQDRCELIQQLLAAEQVDLQALGRLACVGLPSEGGLRAQVWPLLLGYVPAVRGERAQVLAQRRQEYASFCRDFSLATRSSDGAAGDPLDSSEGSEWPQWFRDKEEFEQIRLDIARTHQSIDFFTSGSPASKLHQEEMQRLLFVFSKLNAGLQYVQGMNELVAPLYMVLKGSPASPADADHAEADAFFCFVNLLTASEMRDLYCKSLDKSSSGVRAVLGEFMQRLAEADPAIVRHLNEQDVDPHFFAFRWMTVLFAQDVQDMAVLQRLWDFLLGDPAGCKNAIMRMCCAMLLRKRAQVMAASYPDVVKVCQSCQEFDVEDAINVAASLNPRYLGH